jgi:hypothetical protein
VTATGRSSPRPPASLAQPSPSFSRSPPLPDPTDSPVSSA